MDRELWAQINFYYKNYIHPARLDLGIGKKKCPSCFLSDYINDEEGNDKTN